jgi:hypothetical protein
MTILVLSNILSSKLKHWQWKFLYFDEVIKYLNKDCLKNEGFFKNLVNKEIYISLSLCMATIYFVRVCSEGQLINQLN